MAEGLITPDQLRRITEEKEMAKAREALEKQRKVEDERHYLRDAFMAQEIHPQEIHPEVFERVSRVVKSAAERGEREVLVHRGVQKIHPMSALVWLAPRKWGVRRQGRMNLLSAPVH